MIIFLDESDTALLEIQTLLQTAVPSPQSSMHTYKVGFLIIENISVILNNDNPVERLRFEIDPALNFRGRKATDFKPKKSTKRNGESSEPMAPRYFADRENHHYLNLLV